LGKVFERLWNRNIMILYHHPLSSSWERFLKGCETGILWSSIIILYHPLGKGFWKVVKQEYYDPLSSSSIILLGKVFERLWNRNIMILYHPLSSSWERFLEGCETGILSSSSDRGRTVEWYKSVNLHHCVWYRMIVLCMRAMGASEIGQNQANKKWVT
jgi:hypothetical protein